MFSIRTAGWSVALAGCLGCTSSLCAQTGECRLRGSVTDATGAAIPGALITLSPDSSVAATVTVKSSAAGTFEACDTPAAGYTARIAAEGFAALSQHIDLPGKALTIVLHVAGATDEATVTAGETDKVEVDPSAIGTGLALSQKQLADIPLNGRSFTDTLAIAPGVVPISSAQPNAVVMSGVASTPPSGDLDIGALSVSGQRETSNAFRVNAANVQEDVNMGLAIVPTIDSIADLQVLTSAMDAQYGNQSGGQILVTTKSGTDTLHGSAYDYFRNTALDARNFFSLTRAPFHQNQFGGTIGGVIPRSKSYFFADYQGTHQTQGIDTGLIAVPSTADRTGNLNDIAAQLTGAVSGSSFASLLSQRLGYTALRVSRTTPLAALFKPASSPKPASRPPPSPPPHSTCFNTSPLPTMAPPSSPPRATRKRFATTKLPFASTVKPASASSAATTSPMTTPCSTPIPLVRAAQPSQASTQKTTAAPSSTA